MNQIKYLNEALGFGYFGHFALLLSFVAAGVAALSYFFATQYRADALVSRSWLRLGRAAFGVHALALWSVVFTVFYVMTNHRFEYHYAWQHVSTELPFKYVFSAFWEGQEGSFMLWMFWHSVMGLLLMWKGKAWEAPVLSTLASIQICLLTMLLGLYIPYGTGLEAHIGVSPFRLLRDTQVGAPIFSRPNYLEMIKGNGLNPLLQNWWMTIHPPTLFYGFASTSIPFCYAIAGLWTRQHREWVSACLPWALMSGAVLGTGILMGGAWAYEALSFGGYWAWDPVENMSLVPWLTLVAAIHSLLIAKHTGHSIKAAYLFCILTFVLILYSTFLTRSGVLGETSVHAFTEMGLEWQLVGLMTIYAVLGFGLYIARQRSIPTLAKEESAYSREFWMFIGALVLLFSTILITFTTSIPVWNKVITYFGGVMHFDHRTWLRNPPVNIVGHYNQYQIWIAVLIGILTASVQFMRYKATDGSTGLNRFYVLHVGTAAVVAVVATALTAKLAEFSAWQHWLLFFAAYFTILANADYIVSVLRGRVSVSGSATAHIGFGVMMLGVLFSGVKKETISSQSFMKVASKTQQGFTEEDAANNVLLYRKLPTQMANYELTYSADSLAGYSRFFKVHYRRFDAKDPKKSTLEEFDLSPNILYTLQRDKIAASNPSTKHYLTKDIFTHISSLPVEQVDAVEAAKARDSIKFVSHAIREGDTIFTSHNYITFDRLAPAKPDDDYQPQPGDIAITARLIIRSLDHPDTTIVEPRYVIRGNTGTGTEVEAKGEGLIFRFLRIDGANKRVELEVGEAAPKKDFIVLTAILFPGINLVWLGASMMMLGLLMAMFQRIRAAAAVQSVSPALDN